MKVLFDHQIFTFQRYGGISRLHYEIFKNLEEIEGVSPEFIVKYSNNNYLKPGEFNHKPLFPEKNGFIYKLLMKTLNDREVVKRMKEPYDIFHPTYYDPYFLKHLKGKPFVLTYYDLTHERFPSGVSKLDFTIPWKKKLVEEATHIIAISESTKKDIVEYYSIPEEKVTVIHLASDFKPAGNDEDFKKKLNLPDKYLLFTGNRKWYKNFDTMLKGIAPILKKHNIKLVTVGGGEYSDTENQLVKELDVENHVVKFGFKDSDELAYIYSKALAFIFPSKYEGFGIPVVEAFNCDCPNILANVSSLPEVGGDAAVYFDPESPESIGQAVEKVVVDSNLRQSLIKKGRERRKSFSWRKNAEQTVEVYKKVLGLK